MTNHKNHKHQDDTVLEIDSIEKNAHPKSDVIKLVENSGLQNRHSFDPADDTELEFDRIEDKVHTESEAIDLVLEQGPQRPIDIVIESGTINQIDLILDQKPKDQDSRDAIENSDLEIDGGETDDAGNTVKFGIIRDNPVYQSPANELLFDNENKNLNTACKNGMVQFQIGETLPQGNVKTWVPILLSKWCIKLAKRGHKGAQHRLGCMYALGSGVKKNQIMAYTWYKVAALQKSSGALSKLNKIESKLTSAHIHYAKELSEQYYKLYVVPFQARLNS